MLAASDKLDAKRKLTEWGLPTACWYTLDEGWSGGSGLPVEGSLGPVNRVIVKSVWEHASFGMHDDAVVELPSSATESSLEVILRKRIHATGRPLFAEQFIEGREFNLSVLAGTEHAQVLPRPRLILPHFHLVDLALSAIRRNGISVHSSTSTRLGGLTLMPRTVRCSTRCSNLRLAVGGNSTCAVTPVWTCAWTQQVAPGFWKSM